MSARPRNSWLELARILAMFLIVVSHVAQAAWGVNLAHSWTGALWRMSSIGQFGVIVFFLISGWFARPTANYRRRLLTLWLQTLCYTVGSLLVCTVLWLVRFRPAFIADAFASRRTGLGTLAWTLTPVLRGTYWFISAYIILMLVSPLLTRFLAELSSRTIGYILIFLAFLSLWRFYAVVPNRYSIDGWNLLTYALTTYILGIFLARHQAFIAQRLPYWLTLTVPVLTFAACVAVFRYAAPTSLLGRYFLSYSFAFSIFQFLIGGGLFLFFAKLSLVRPAFSRRAVNRLSTAMLGVYLLHELPVFLEPLWTGLLNRLPAPTGFLPTAGAILAASLVLFAVCALLSLVYEALVFQPLRRALNTLLERLERLGQRERPGRQVAQQQGDRQG